ncbi:AAA family ATPase [Streptococcus anginosus]|uniref:AAA family ATPase n=1 Tax=Streptococcus anginosus TaxID=1328 RepID=A0A2T0G8M3_STRAP|nr:AAA family ATPase [Streptococcus anginosus]
MAQLVIIRGNSGSGKTSLAKKLQNHFGRRTLVISQDLVRRDMLKEKVEPDNLSISLTETIARYGHEHDMLVIVEGFYETDIYGDMLERLRQAF